MKYLHLNQYNVLCNKCNNQVMSKQNQHTETKRDPNRLRLILLIRVLVLGLFSLN